MNRNVIQLALAQAVMMSVNSLMVTAAAIIGSHLAANKAFATLPLALYAALASFSAGALLHQWGWQLVNYAVAPLILLVVLAHVWLWLTNKRRLVVTGH